MRSNSAANPACVKAKVPSQRAANPRDLPGRNGSGVVDGPGAKGEDVLVNTEHMRSRLREAFRPLGVEE